MVRGIPLKSILMQRTLAAVAVESPIWKEGAVELVTLPVLAYTTLVEPLVTKLPLSAPCDLIASPVLEVMVQPSCQLPVVATVTLLLRLMASLLAKIKVANISKLAALTCWL